MPLRLPWMTSACGKMYNSPSQNSSSCSRWCFTIDLTIEPERLQWTKRNGILICFISEPESLSWTVTGSISSTYSFNCFQLKDQECKRVLGYWYYYIPYFTNRQTAMRAMIHTPSWLDCPIIKKSLIIVIFCFSLNWHFFGFFSPACILNREQIVKRNVMDKQKWDKKY